MQMSVRRLLEHPWQRSADETQMMVMQCLLQEAGRIAALAFPSPTGEECYK
jgi:hypothetical protein